MADNGGPGPQPLATIPLWVILTAGGVLVVGVAILGVILAKGSGTGAPTNTTGTSSASGAANSGTTADSSTGLGNAPQQYIPVSNSYISSDTSINDSAIGQNAVSTVAPTTNSNNTTGSNNPVSVDTNVVHPNPPPPPPPGPPTPPPPPPPPPPPGPPPPPVPPPTPPPTQTQTGYNYYEDFNSQFNQHGETVPIGGKDYVFGPTAGTGQVNHLWNVAVQEYGAYGNAVNTLTQDIINANPNLQGKSFTYQPPVGTKITIPGEPPSVWPSQPVYTASGE